MGNDVLLAVKTTAAAFETLLALFLLPTAFARRPGRDVPGAVFRLLLAAGLVKSALDTAYGIAAGAIPMAAYAEAASGFEMAAATLWYLFIAAYLWNGPGAMARSLKPAAFWLVAWAAAAAAGLHQALCWLPAVPYALAELLVLARRERLPARDAALMALFPLPMAAGLLLCYLNPALNWKSPGLSMALLAVSLYLQSSTSQRDPLTGAHTRSWFKAHLAGRLKEARTSPFTLMMIDLDNFKKINDTWGHLEGDRALVTVVELLRRSLRSTDVIARFAGDEFLVLAGLSGAGECAIIQRRIQQHLLAYNMNSGKPYTLGWSTGTIYCDKPRNLDELLASVDEHMYRAKKERKDRLGQAPGRLYTGSTQKPKAI